MKPIKQSQILGSIVNTVTGTGVNNTDPKNPVINLPDLSAYATKLWVQQQNYLTEEDDPTGVASLVFSGTTTKTLTITLNNGTQISNTFDDLNSTYLGLTLADLNNSPSDTTNKLISSAVLNQYINSKLSSVMSYKGQVQNYAALPNSGNKIGDIYNVVDADPTHQLRAGDNVAWNGTDWDVMSGWIDTSAFLTEEFDPKGVDNLEVTGDAIKTIKVTLRDGTIFTQTFTDNDTTYRTGNLALLQATTPDTILSVWSPQTLNQWLNAKGFITLADLPAVGIPQEDKFTVVAGHIVSGLVTLLLTNTPRLQDHVLLFYNNVYIPTSAYTRAGVTLKITNSLLPTPIEVGDEVVAVYKKN